jgi:hypothetical protein
VELLLQVKKLVETALEQYEQTRNDDKLLLFLILHKIKYPHWDLRAGFSTMTVRSADLAKFPSPESIIRARAYIQNVEKKFLPTDEAVIKKRRLQQKEYRAFAKGKLFL